MVVSSSKARITMQEDLTSGSMNHPHHHLFSSIQNLSQNDSLQKATNGNANNNHHQVKGNEEILLMGQMMAWFQGVQTALSMINPKAIMDSSSSAASDSGIISDEPLELLKKPTTTTNNNTSLSCSSNLSSDLNSTMSSGDDEVITSSPHNNQRCSKRSPPSPSPGSIDDSSSSTTRRIKANARERTRVHTISAAFDSLRNSVPTHSTGQKLSKLAVLRIATCYIETLAACLTEGPTTTTQLSLDMPEDLSVNKKKKRKLDETEPRLVEKIPRYHPELSFEECVSQLNDTIHMESKSRRSHNAY